MPYYLVGKELKNSGFEQTRTKSQRIWGKIGILEDDAFVKGDSFHKNPIVIVKVWRLF